MSTCTSVKCMQKMKEIDLFPNILTLLGNKEIGCSCPQKSFNFFHCLTYCIPPSDVRGPSRLMRMQLRGSGLFFIVSCQTAAMKLIFQLNSSFECCTVMITDCPVFILKLLRALSCWAQLGASH